LSDFDREKAIIKEKWTGKRKRYKSTFKAALGREREASATRGR